MTAPPSRPESIAGRLRDEILSGLYRAGDRLPAERDLAARLEVNRASVREALRILEQLGLVSIRPGDGARVRHVQEASLDLVRHLLFRDGKVNLPAAVQVLDVYEMLVSGAARLAVERGSDDELLHARELLTKLGDGATAPEDWPGIIDQLFEVMTAASENLVVRLCRNAIGAALASDLGHSFWKLVRPSADTIREEARAIDRAVVARDPVATEEAVRAMIRERRIRLLAALEDPDFKSAPQFDATRLTSQEGYPA
ncbi:MAG: GntR family transcriptional regulator [Proteobacteria bacterium]|nr:GntR family transcriptional regulator [Pseudomonadota bacterium]MCZ6785151.1 GntR family transcriptional regulator [Pseudomonadota bacterium]